MTSPTSAGSKDNVALKNVTDSWKDIAPASLAEKLVKAGFATPFDLLLHLPSGYRSRSAVHLKSGRKDLLSVEATMRGVAAVGRGRKHLQCTAETADGTLVKIRFFNYNRNMQAWLEGLDEIVVSGEPQRSGKTLEFHHPRIARKGKAADEGYICQYPKVAGLADTQLRQIVGKALEKTDLSETIPEHILQSMGLPTLRESLFAYHQPGRNDPERLIDKSHPAMHMIKFSEWLSYQLMMRRSYHTTKTLDAPTVRNSNIDRNIIDQLPFSLTESQTKAWKAIRKDLCGTTPMRRLLHGDVGSGKTVVAGLACAMAADSGLLAAFMAPTELLAEQHYATLQPILAQADVLCELLTGSSKASQRKKVASTLVTEERRIIFGTHALFQKGVDLPNLGLVVIDEQHRFGVKQRNALARKGGTPHQLMLSATPIPRTLSMGLFSDLDISVIDEKPPGRMPVRTQVYRADKRKQILKQIDCKLDGQVYWVCPLIEDSEKQDLLSAATLYEMVRGQFPGITAGMIHGKMPARDKTEVLASFKSGKIRMVVATTVVEVGIDAPEADVMVIEHAERMGLSQMHQLRGRVGRGNRPGYCLLLHSGTLTPDARKRIKVIRDSTDGFEIAHEDLKIRGLGEWLGASQSGMKMRFIDPLVDHSLVKQARAVAEAMVSTGGSGVEMHLRRWLRQKPS